MKRSITIEYLVNDCKNKDFLLDEGFLLLGKAPSKKFIPDFSKLVKSIDELYMLGDLIKDMDDSQIRLLIAALYHSSRLAKFNLHFAQPVYFNISSPAVDFVDCWYKGYAVSANRYKYTYKKEKIWEYTILVISNLKRSWETTLHISPKNILNKEQFYEHKKKLLEEGKIRAPKLNLDIFRQKWADVSNEETDADKIESVTDNIKEITEAVNMEVKYERKQKRRRKKKRKSKLKINQDGSIRLV